MQGLAFILLDIQVEFIDGAQIVNPDACFFPKRKKEITLHVIDRVLMPTTRTIADFLESDPRFSLFTEALTFARVLDFLDKEDVSRTVFVPTNDAFTNRIPPDLFNCLLNYMRLPLNDVVLYHIARGTEYTPSLCLRGYTYTLQLSAINLRKNGSVITFLTDPPSNIIEPNIPASNGVIHVVDNLLIPPNLDFGGCSEFVPTTTPAPTDPPTTAPPTTADPLTTTTDPSNITGLVNLVNQEPDPPKKEETGLLNEGETDPPKEKETGLPNEGETDPPKEKETGLPNEGETDPPKEKETGLLNEGETDPPKEEDQKEEVTDIFVDYSLNP